MSLPIINFKATNIELDEYLADVVTEKFKAFEKFVGDETDVKCDVEFEKVADHKSGAVHRVEANLWIAGKLYRAEATMNSFEQAIDEVRNELDKELSRGHDKSMSLLKKGGRKIKEMLRFGKES